MVLPGKRMKRIERAKRVFNAVTMRRAVAAESRAVMPVEGVRFTPYNPAAHSTAVIERRLLNPKQQPIQPTQGSEKHPKKFDVVKIGSKVVATNDPSKFIERRKKGNRFDLKA